MVEGQIMQVLGKRVVLVSDSEGNTCKNCCFREDCNKTEREFLPCFDLDVFGYHFVEITNNQ